MEVSRPVIKRDKVLSDYTDKVLSDYTDKVLSDYTDKVLSDYKHVSTLTSDHRDENLWHLRQPFQNLNRFQISRTFQ